MQSILNFVSRHSLWVLLGSLAFLVLRPGLPELNTILLVVFVESLAIALSGLALYIYTKVDFTKDGANANLGYIFLGVHLLVGLVVLGAYIVQFSN
jgi:hypothetical protein